MNPNITKLDYSVNISYLSTFWSALPPAEGLALYHDPALTGWDQCERLGCMSQLSKVYEGDENHHGKNRHDSIPLSMKHILSYIYLNILSYHGFVCCGAINLANNLAIILWTLVSLLSWPTCSIGKVTKKLSFFKLRLTTRVQVRLFITFPNHSAKLGKPSSFLHKCCQKDLTKGCCKLQRW